MDNSIEIPQDEILDDSEWETYVREELEKEVAVFWRKASRAYFPDKNLEVPPVKWMGGNSDAGRAPFSDWENLTGYSIELNWDLAKDSIENFAEFRDQVIPHEICHIIAILFFGIPRRINSHGKTEFHFHGIEWQSTMIKMGKNPDRTHNMNTQVVSGRNFVYKCPGCGKEFHLTKILYNRIQNGQKRYCGICKSKSPIVFVREDGMQEIVAID